MAPKFRFKHHLIDTELPHAFYAQTALVDLDNDGRLGLDKFMDCVPAHFAVGFAEDGDLKAASRVIDSALRELDVRLGNLEVN
jgi:hypothetical protein